MSILQVVRSAEVADLAAKFRKAKHGVDRLKIILENQELIIYLPPKKELLRSDVETLFALGDAVILFGDLNSKSTQWRCNYTNANGRKMIDLAKDLHFDVIAPPTQTYFPNNVRNRPDILDIALMRRVALNVRCIETPKSQFGSPPSPPENRASRRRTAPKQNNHKLEKVSLLLERLTILNNIPDNIETTDEIDYAIGALTNHIATVIEDSSREVPAADSRRKLPEDVRVLLKAKTQPCVARAHIRHAK
ncbi:RNA-directed DNA polymerase from mobile element jockey [Eumeta japonica]|uniref:RNA-directed DNA polymerase from mobile element jockey n=1 Tax=Eumeta variegata TaxID=151549 RepID=A0A4C1ZVI3_EUMVA|nr:RNA-directed DNA polymerase from mobile element jockey [Eumeta japonica]